MTTKKIIVNQPLEIQRHVLKIAEEKTDQEILNVIKSLQNNKARVNNAKNGEYLKVWNAYANGWRGNFIDKEPKINDESKAIVTSVSVSKSSTGVTSVGTDKISIEEPSKSKPYEKPTDYDVASKFLSLYGNAKTRDKEFGLTLTDVRRLLTKKRCEYTGVELTKATTALPTATDRTIDRLDAEIGYVTGNVFAVSHSANSLKNVLFEKEGEHKTTVEFIHGMTSRIMKLKSCTEVEE
jgi:hypothetical protein